MSEETPQAAAERAVLRAKIIEALPKIAAAAVAVANARAELAGQHSGVFDPQVHYDRRFARAADDLVHYAYIALQLCPIKEEEEEA